MGIDLEKRTVPLCINGHDHALGAEFRGLCSNSGCATAKELTLTFSRTCVQQIGIILNAADASADRKGI